MPSNVLYLFQARTTDGNGTATPLPFPNRAKVKAYGTWGGASVKLQSLASDVSTWIDVTQLEADGTFTPITFSANNQIVLEGIIQNESFRAVMSNDGMTTSVTVEIEGF
jgi:hypothetical protein